MKTIRNVLFDFFDVVHSDYQKAWLAANGLARDGAYAEASDLLDLGIITYPQYLQRFAAAGGITPAQLVREFDAMSHIHDDVVELIQGARDQGIKTCLVSNAAASEIRKLFHTYKLDELFDAVVVSGAVGVKKPDPAIFGIALRAIAARPEETAFVDDNPDNVAAARDLGIYGIHHTGIKALEHGLRRAGITITKGEQVCAVL